MPCSKGMTGCARSCAHRSMVREYRAARAASEAQREQATLGYATEMREWGAGLTFGVWLRSMRRGQEEAA